MNDNPGRAVTTFQIVNIFGEAYLKAAVPLNAINGFAKTGICPNNPDVFTEGDFIAASTTEMDLDGEGEEPATSTSNPMQLERPNTGADQIQKMRRSCDKKPRHLYQDLAGHLYPLPHCLEVVMLGILTFRQPR